MIGVVTNRAYQGGARPHLSEGVPTPDTAGIPTRRREFQLPILPIRRAFPPVGGSSNSRYGGRFHP